MKGEQREIKKEMKKIKKKDKEERRRWMKKMNKLCVSLKSIICVLLLAVCHYWRASVASETLTGVTQLKIGDVCLYMFGRTYVILYFDPRVFVFVMWSSPSQIALNRILWFIDQFPYHPRNWIVYRFELFCGCS